MVTLLFAAAGLIAVFAGSTSCVIFLSKRAPQIENCDCRGECRLRKVAHVAAFSGRGRIYRCVQSRN